VIPFVRKYNLNQIIQSVIDEQRRNG
jgi:hypothetical protein